MLLLMMMMEISHFEEGAESMLPSVPLEEMK